MHGEIFNWKGRLGPIDLLVSSKTFTPSTVTTLLANVLEIGAGDAVIDVGCGTGILSIIAAELGASHVDALDQSPDVVEVGNHNATLRGVADRITFHCGDLFEPLPDDCQADVIIGDVSGIPDALAIDSGWFPSGKGGGARGSELPIRMLQDAAKHLAPGGRLFLPTGTLQDEAAIMEAARSKYANVRMLTERRIPLPPGLAESDAITGLVEAGIVSVTPKGSRYFWEARMWELSSPA